MIGGGDKIPTVGTLDKPENLDTLLREDRGDDCTSCRVIGEDPSLVQRNVGMLMRRCCV